MRQVCIIAALLLSAAAQAQSGHQLWSMKLTGEGGIQTFERGGRAIWLRQQGVVFVSPERLVIYQVNRRQEVAPLAKRGPSGGSGNYILLARVLDARSGREIQRFRLVTSAESSSILPTHDGKFIVRAGKMLALYSENFEVLKARELPEGQAPVDYWQVAVTPSGRQIVVAHQQLRVNPESPLDASRTWSQADLEYLDADTFASLRKLHVTHHVPVWAPHEKFLLMTTPGKLPGDSGVTFGTMSFDGHWSSLQQPWMDKKSHCIYNFDLLDHGLMAARGCNDLTVFAPFAEKILSLEAGNMRRFSSVAAADHSLAVEVSEFVVPVARLPGMEPTRIEVYDLITGEKTISVSVEAKTLKYAVSNDGLLAVVDRDTLAVYEQIRTTESQGHVEEKQKKVGLSPTSGQGFP
jgi:hypothetical protein